MTRRTRVLLVGAGGHAQVVADILLRIHQDDNDIVPIGYLDDNPGLVGHTYLSLPVLGRIEELSSIAHDAILIAIGDNATRCRLFSLLKSKGEQFATACHPRAVIAPDVPLGAGTVVCAGVVVNTGSVIGANVILNTGCTVDHHNQVGDHVHVAPGVHLGGDVRIGEGALLGIGTTVMPQRQVDEWSIISAGSLVHRDVGARVVAAGVPARIIRRLVED
jgi:sugar O-acyltransferase (sialic acid O-acetyltransferase NeuD family)